MFGEVLVMEVDRSLAVEQLCRCKSRHTSVNYDLCLNFKIVPIVLRFPKRNQIIFMYF